MYSEFDNSMPFNIDLDSDNAEFCRIYDDIGSEILAFFERRKYVFGKYPAHLKLVLLNLLKASRQNRNRYVAYHRGRAWYYPQKKGQQGLKVSYEPLIQIVAALEALGYVSLKSGVRFPNRSSISRMRATDKLRRLFRRARSTFPDENTIVLKNMEGDWISFSETKETRRMRVNLEKINQRLSQHYIGLYVPDSLENTINKKLVKKRMGLDCSKVALHRSFNRGSFDHGGRFHGGWWITLPKEFRPFTRIDNEETVERDFSGMGLNLLYLSLGLDLPTEDVYLLPEITHERGRDFMKNIAQAILNSRDRVTALKAIQAELNFGGGVYIPLTAEEILDRFTLKHSPIRSMFLRDLGLRFHRYESDITERILLNLVNKGVPALPIHDGFLVRKSDATDLEAAMTGEVVAQYGRSLPFKAGKPSKLQFLAALGADERLRYARYFKEWDEWLQEHRSVSAAVPMSL